MTSTSEFVRETMRNEDAAARLDAKLHFLLPRTERALTVSTHSVSTVSTHGQYPWSVLTVSTCSVPTQYSLSTHYQYSWTGQSQHDEFLPSFLSYVEFQTTNRLFLFFLA